MNNLEKFDDNEERISDAVNVARLYYHQGLKTETIAREMHVSRSTISRLLEYAKTNGLVDIRVNDPNERPRVLEKKFIDQFNIKVFMLFLCRKWPVRPPGWIVWLNLQQFI